jgi:hypothetical protein
VNASTSFIASFGGTQFVTGAAFSPAGAMYVIDYYTGNVYTVNLQTGAAQHVVLVSPPGLGEGFRGLVIDELHTTPPSTETIERGVAIGGSIASYAAVDGDRREFRPGVTLTTALRPIQVVLEADAPNASPASLSVLYTSHASTGNINEQVEIWDFDAPTPGYVMLRNANAAVSADMSYTLTPPSIPSTYVSGANRLRVRISYRANGPVLIYPYTVRINRLVWETS